MNGTGSEQEVPRLPRAESVLGDALAERADGPAYRAFGVAAEDFTRHLAMLEVRLRTGDKFLFPYHLIGPAAWRLSSGMTLVFGDDRITLTGRNLSPLFTAIRDNKASWIQEADRTTAKLVPSTAPLVESIVIEKVRPARGG